MEQQHLVSEIKDWELMATDDVSGRQIFKRDVPVVSLGRPSNYGTYDFRVEAEFEVRDRAGRVLFETSGSASGEYWCGVFLWFVEGTDGTKVRLEESDRAEPLVIDIPESDQTSP
ncbi:MAG: hypothetical protein AAGF29_06680 [Pseudomonadota bacterium]